MSDSLAKFMPDSPNVSDAGERRRETPRLEHPARSGAGPIANRRDDFEERRRHPRFRLKLQGRYMLSDGAEFPCETVDVSSSGMKIRGLKSGRLGGRVVVYIDELGRIEGAITRRASDCFVVEIHASPSKQDRLAARIGWLFKRKQESLSERRRSPRLDLSPEPIVLRTADGSAFSASLIDVSVTGAAILVDVPLPVGAAVLLGDQPAHVSRVFTWGLAVTFDETESTTLGEVPALVV